jgi:hypothetical protein
MYVSKLLSNNVGECNKVKENVDIYKMLVGVEK